MSWFYACTIYPLELAYKYVYTLCASITDSYGIGLVVLSLCTVMIFTPLKRMASSAQKAERELQDVLQPQIQKISAESSGAERHERIAKLYRRYGYHPVMAIRSAFGVALQLPFLMAAYYMISGLTVLQGHSFWFIKDLSQPDGLLNGVNLLPLAMTLINFATTFTSKDMRRKDRLQAVIVALLFFWLLYDAPAALLFYWTGNNLIYLGQNVVAVFYNHGKFFSSLCPSRTSTYAERLIIFDEWIGIVGAMLTCILLQTCCLCFVKYPDVLAKDFLPVQLFALFSLFICCLSALGHRKSRNLFCLVILVAMTALNIYVLHSDSYKVILSILFVDIIAIIECGRSNYCGRNAFSSCIKTESNTIYLAFSAVVAGIAFQLSNNLQYVLSLNSLLYFALFVFVFLFITTLSIRHVSFGTMSFHSFMNIVFAFSVSWLFLPTVQSLLKLHDRTNITFIALFSCLVLLSFFITNCNTAKRYLLVVFCVFAVTSCSVLTNNWNVRIQEEKMTTFDDERMDIMKGLVRKHEGGVYSLVYDSIPDLKTLRALGVDTSRLENILSKYGFKIYPDTYSLGWGSLLSQGLTFSILERKHTKRDFQVNKSCAGDGIVFKIMKHLKYDVKNYQGTYLLGKYMFNGIEYLPQVGERNMLAVFVAGLINGEFQFNQDGKNVLNFFQPVEKMTAKEALRSVKPGKFVACHFNLPSHSQNSGKLLPNETELYIRRLNIALNQMDIDIKTILKKDPDAIIVVYGDHGPYLTGDGVGLKDFKLSEITELMIRDRVGTLVSIKWPNKKRAEKYDCSIRVNQDIFPVVFAYICDSYIPLELLIKNRDGYFEWERKWVNHVFIRNGVFQLQ